MSDQLIDNWNTYYEGSNIPPWEDLVPHEEFLSLVLKYHQPGMRVLELGGGLGHNAIALAKLGVDITASDISSRALHRCKSLADAEGISLPLELIDVMSQDLRFEPFDIVFDKGCWHSFFDSSARSKFVHNVAGLLTCGGIWINSSGSSKNVDEADDPNKNSYPRWDLDGMISLSEPLFDLLESREGYYGTREHNRFKTWECVFKLCPKEPE